MLDLSYHAKLTDSSIGSFIGNMTSVHTLNLTGCTGVTQSSLDYLAQDRFKNYPYIEAVDKGACSSKVVLTVWSRVVNSLRLMIIAVEFFVVVIGCL